MTPVAGIESKLDALIALSGETSPDRRRDLLRDVTDVFFAPTPPPAALRELFGGAMERLADTLEVELRAELSRRLASVSDAPRRLVARLAGDAEDEVAEPVLERSPALEEADLLGAVRVGGQGRLRAVSRRDDLTESVADVIVERGDDETVGVLVANPHAPLSREASEAVVDRAKLNPALHSAVVERESLPLDLLNDLYLFVEQRLREKIQARNATADLTPIEALLRRSRHHLATQAGALPADYEAGVAEVDALTAAGGVWPQHIAGFLQAGRRTTFSAALAQAAGVDFGVVKRVLDRGDTDAFALLCKAAGYSDDLFRTALKLRGGEGLPLEALVARFAALPRETAQRVVRFWNVRQGASLAA